MSSLPLVSMSGVSIQPDHIARPISYADARDLTADLREHLAISGALLLEAYERQAWRALGYATWSDYVKRELTSAMSSIQRRLDHTRLMRALETLGVPPERVPTVPLVMANEVLRSVDRIEAATEPVDEVMAIVQAIRQRSMPAVTNDEIERVFMRMQPLIERAAQRVGLDPMAWLERAVTASAQVVGCD